MASARTLQRLELWIWVLLYGGLLGGVVLGLATARWDAPLGQWLVGVGLLLTLTGLGLVWLRSRLRADPPPR